METLDSTLERLTRALDRLTAAVKARDERLAEKTGALENALKVAQAEQAQTAAAAEIVSARLNDAIDRLNAVLET